MEIKDRIKIVRKEKGLSQTEFAAKMFMTKDAISNIERGINGASDRTIEMICSTFNVNKDWLVDGEGEMFLLPVDEDVALMAKMLATDESPATVELLKAFLKAYFRMSDDARKKWDALLMEEVAKIKKDPE